jgi:NAD(P)-dependent dehydrogenase (short-subunit alcohol dehydrogenase family)
MVLGEALMAIALITGTSSGIGLATAVTLARGGHKVIATMRNLGAAGEIHRIIDAEGLPVTVAALDVNDDGSVNDAIDRVLAEDGRIDVLVNNAGVPGGGAPVEEVPMEVFRQVMETNFFGGLRCIKAVMPSMREHRHGCSAARSLKVALMIAPVHDDAEIETAIIALRRSEQSEHAIYPTPDPGHGRRSAVESQCQLGLVLHRGHEPPN